MIPFRREREVIVHSVLICVRSEIAAQAVANAAAQLGLGDIVSAAVGGAEAIARAAGSPPDVLLVDTLAVRPDTVGFTRRVLERSPDAVIIYFGPEDAAVARAAVN